MKLCVFAGTFNPIHKTHLKMACDALEKYDKVLFIPAYKPPHKNFDPAVNDMMSRHRLEMVKIATQNEPRFEVSDIEFQSEEISYTYNTIKQLYNGEKIGFIIGSDAYEKIDTWYKADELKQMLNFIIYPREDDVSSSAYRRGKKGIVTDEVECYIREHELYANN